MFCTTECWNCEDKNCENYISKQELFFDNQLLKTVLDEIREQIKKIKPDLDFEPWAVYKVIGTNLFDLIQILDKVKEL